MKFLHLADLHIGKRLKEESLIADQKYILNKILSVVEEKGTDGVFIAGDVYDKSVPSAEAVTLFDEFLSKLKQKGQEIFIVAGNHDSVERLSFASELLKTSGVHVSKTYFGRVEKVPFRKGDESVNVYLLPFIRPISVKTYYPDDNIASYSDAVAVALSKEEIDKMQTNVLITHQFVTGAIESGSEEMTVGGINNVELSCFDNFDYVALGHIHKRQSMRGGTVHYPGTPLKYSLSEANEPRTLTVVTIEGKHISTEQVPLTPLRDLREVKGDFFQLMNDSSEDYVYLVLTNEDEIPFAVRELRKKYPNLLQVRYENRRSREAQKLSDGASAKTPLELFDELFTKQNNITMSENQSKFIEKLIESIWEKEE